jgi:hypothetical protein
MWSEDVNAKGGLLGRGVNLSAMTTKAAPFTVPSRIHPVPVHPIEQSSAHYCCSQAGVLRDQHFNKAAMPALTGQPPLKASVLSGAVIGFIAGSGGILLAP